MENNLAGWKKTGVFPFSRCVQVRLKAEELAKSRSTGHLRRKYVPPPSVETAFNTCADALLAAQNSRPNAIPDGEQLSDADTSDAEIEAVLSRKTTQFSSAQLFTLGPVTGGKGLEIVKQRAKDKNDGLVEKKRKLDERTQIAESKQIINHEQGKTIIRDLDSGILPFSKLTVCQLDACMTFYNLPVVKGKVALKSAALFQARVQRSSVLHPIPNHNPNLTPIPTLTLTPTPTSTITPTPTPTQT